MLLEGVRKDHLVKYAGRTDVCEFKARELAISERIDLVQAKNKLKGELEGELVLKYRQSGIDIVLSMDTIHDLSERYKSTRKSSASKEVEKEAEKEGEGSV